LTLARCVLPPFQYAGAISRAKDDDDNGNYAYTIDASAVKKAIGVNKRLNIEASDTGTPGRLVNDNRYRLHPYGKQLDQNVELHLILKGMMPHLIGVNTRLIRGGAEVTQGEEVGQFRIGTAIDGPALSQVSLHASMSSC
jgi:hypothetical protein